MNIRRKIILSSALMFILPVILICIVTVLFLAIFILSYSAQEHLNIIELLNPTMLVQTIGSVIVSNPDSVKYLYLWLFICLAIIICVIFANTVILSKSICTPIRELTKSVDSMKYGDFDWGF